MLGMLCWKGRNIALFRAHLTVTFPNLSSRALRPSWGSIAECKVGIGTIPLCPSIRTHHYLFARREGLLHVYSMHPRTFLFSRLAYTRSSRLVQRLEIILRRAIAHAYTGVYTCVYVRSPTPSLAHACIGIRADSAIASAIDASRSFFTSVVVRIEVRVPSPLASNSLCRVVSRYIASFPVLS